MSMSRAAKGTGGAFSPSPITVLASNDNIGKKSLVFSIVFMANTSTRAAASDWLYASGSWNSMVAASGWTDLNLAKDPPSVSPYPRAPGSESESEASADPAPRTVLLVEDNPTDVFVIKEAIERSGLKVQSPRRRQRTGGAAVFRRFGE